MHSFEVAVIALLGNVMLCLSSDLCGAARGELRSHTNTAAMIDADGQSPSACSSRDETVESLVDWLQTWERRFTDRAIRSAFSMTVLRTRSIRPGEEVTWDETDWLDKYEYQWVYDASRRRFAGNAHRVSSDGLVQAEGVTTRVVWDGQRWVRFREQSRTWTMSSLQRVDDKLDSIFLFDRIPGPSVVSARQPLSEVIQTGSLVSIDREGTVATYRVRIREGRYVELTIDHGLQPKLISVKRLIFAGDKNLVEEQSPVIVVEHRVTDWLQIGDVLVPQRAVRDFTDHLERVGRRSGWTGRTVIERKDYAILDDDPLDTVFEVAKRDGDLIFDNRFRIQYVHGTDRILIDGVPYHTDMLLTRDVGKQLPHLRLMKILDEDARPKSEREGSSQ